MGKEALCVRGCVRARVWTRGLGVLVCLAGERPLMLTPESWAFQGLVRVNSSPRPLLMPGGPGKV